MTQQLDAVLPEASAVSIAAKMQNDAGAEEVRTKGKTKLSMCRHIPKMLQRFL